MPRRRIRRSSGLSPLAELFGVGLAGFIAKKYVDNKVQQEQDRHRVGMGEWRRQLMSVDDLSNLGDQQFEDYVSIIFETMGYTTHTRGHVNAADGGVDIEARRPGEYIIVQCKRYALNNKVSINEVGYFLGTIEKEKATKGYLVTTGYFTDKAKEWAKSSHKINLVDIDGVRDWLRIYQIGPYGQSAPLYQEDHGVEGNSIIKSPLALTNPQDQTIFLYQSPPSSSSVVIPKKGMATWQIIILLVLTVIATLICACASLMILAAIIGPTPS